MSDWVSPITHILSPADMEKLVTEAASNGQPMFEDGLAALEAFGAANFVVSSLATDGTGYSVAGQDAATLYIRQPITIDVADSADNDWITGKIKIRIETRVSFRMHHASVAVQLVNL